MIKAEHVENVVVVSNEGERVLRLSPEAAIKLSQELLDCAGRAIEKDYSV